MFSRPIRNRITEMDLKTLADRKVPLLCKENITRTLSFAKGRIARIANSAYKN